MKVYTGRGLGDMYYQLVRDITEHGRTIDTRYGPCLELPEPIVLEYTEPGYCFMSIPGRRWNPFLALAEVFWILTGNGNADWISYYSKTMLQFKDPGSDDFHGAYGMRMRKWKPGKQEGTIDQVQEVIRKLRTDSFTRRAVISLWDPWRDNVFPSNDYPCNNWAAFTLRDGVLNQTVVIRSNDLVLGTPMNAVQFTHLQAYIAGCVGVNMGKLTYVVNNLHYYQDFYKPALAKLIEKAYDHYDGRSDTLEARKIKCFSTFTDSELMISSRDLERIRNREATLQPYNEYTHSKYLTEITVALSVFISLKEKAFPPGVIASFIRGLDPLLEELIVDFYESSASPLVQEVLGILRRKDAVTIGK